MKRSTMIGTVLALLVALILLGGASCSSLPDSPQTGTGGATINPDVSYCPVDHEIIIHNNDTFDWTQVVLTIDNAFKYDAAGIRAGKTLTVKVSAFKTANGTVFSGTPAYMTIECQTPSGKVSLIAIN